MSHSSNRAPSRTSGQADEAGLPHDIRHLSPRELRALGVSEIAYIKPVTVDGEAVFAIHAADGTPMALTGDRDVALAAVLQHQMVPTLVH